MKGNFAAQQYTKNDENFNKKVLPCSETPWTVDLNSRLKENSPYEPVSSEE
jgi:hypothetical protein